MVTTITDYKTPAEFAKEYIKRNGSKGVSKAYILELIHEELATPGTCGIDVIVIPGHPKNFYLVRMSAFNTKTAAKETAQYLKEIISKI
jgi:hypothetical protein